MLAVAGGLVGEVLRRRLATGGYRLDDETGPPPRVRSRVVPVALALLWGLLAWRFGPLSEWALAPAYLGFAFVAVALAWVDADVTACPGTHPAGIPAARGAAGARVARLGGLGGAAPGGDRRRRAVGGLLRARGAGGAAGQRLRLGDVTLAGLVGLATGYVERHGDARRVVRRLPARRGLRLARIVLRRGTRKDDIAFGPWMLVGTLIALVVEVRPLL